MSERPVLPPPKRRESGIGMYRPGRASQLLLAPGHDPAIRGTARDLQAAFLTAGAGHIPVAGRYGMDDAPKPIVLLEWHHAAEVAPRIASALPEPDGEEGYVLDITPQHIALVAGGPAGLFYGAQTLRQLLGTGGRVQAERITDWPALPLRGVMIDVARGKVPKLETLLQIADLLARCKANVLQLYNEHAFAWQRHPVIGANRGPFTADELLTLDSYCAQRHIDFIPTLQSLGHCEGILRHKRYQELDESGKRWTLSPAHPGTYDLLNDLYAEYLPNFRSQFFNACCDEPWDLGEGQAASAVRERGLIGVYLDHVLRLREIVKAYGKQLMIWGDVVIAHPECLRELPDDLVILDWWYEPEHDFDRVAKYAEMGQPYLVCPGTSSWNGFTTRLPAAMANISGHVTAAVRHGASGLLCTDWGDNGHFNSLGTTWYAHAYASAMAWAGGELDVKGFDTAFSAFAFADPKGATARVYHAQGRTHDAAGLTAWNSSPYYWLLFEPVEAGPFCEGLSPAKQKRALAALDRADAALDRAKPAFASTETTYRELRWGNTLSRHAVARAALVREERAARAGRSAAAAGARRREAKRLARQLERLRDEFVDLWRRRNREADLAVSLARLDEVIASYETIGRP